MKRSCGVSETAGGTGRTRNFQSTTADKTSDDFAGCQEETEGLLLALLNDSLQSAAAYVVNYSAGRGAE